MALAPPLRRLETDIATLEQHLENMRATYQLNTEKLEYNYRVLVERDHENQATVTQQKRKISRQRDILVNLKQKYSDMDKKYQDENCKLTDEYRRITEQFKDLQVRHTRGVCGPERGGRDSLGLIQGFAFYATPYVGRREFRASCILVHCCIRCISFGG